MMKWGSGAVCAAMFAMPVQGATLIEFRVTATIPVVAYQNNDPARYYDLPLDAVVFGQSPDGISFSFENSGGDQIARRRVISGTATYLGAGQYRGTLLRYLEGWLNYSIYGSTTTFTINQVNPAPVPEPLAWALLIAGFAGLGMTMRRRSTGLPLSARASQYPVAASA